MSQRYIYLLCSDLASAEKSVKKRTQFFSYCKMGTRSSKFVFYGPDNQISRSLFTLVCLSLVKLSPVKSTLVLKPATFCFQGNFLCYFSQVKVTPVVLAVIGPIVSGQAVNFSFDTACLKPTVLVKLKFVQLSKVELS